MAQVQSNTESVFRIDTFVVPDAARDAFLAKVSETHELLGRMDGCLQNRVLEKVAGPGKFNIVTLVEWSDASSFERARAFMKNRHEQTGFNAQDFWSRLGIEAQIANYEGCEGL